MSDENYERLIFDLHVAKEFREYSVDQFWALAEQGVAACRQRRLPLQFRRLPMGCMIHDILKSLNELTQPEAVKTYIKERKEEEIRKAMRNRPTWPVPEIDASDS